MIFEENGKEILIRFEDGDDRWTIRWVLKALYEAFRGREQLISPVSPLSLPDIHVPSLSTLVD
jgi:hypothetical protein